MSKHTTGPWIYYADLPSAEPNWHIVTTANKMRVLANVHIEPGNAMDEANACLISAAPEMLEALQIAECGIEELCNGQHEDNECWNILRTVRAAISKATTA